MMRTIKLRILTGYAAVLLFTFIAAVVLTKNNSQVSTQVDGFVSDTLPTLAKLDAIQSNSKQLTLIGYSLYGITISGEDFEAQRSELVSLIERDLNALKGLSVAGVRNAFSPLDSAMVELASTMSAGRVNWDKARDNLQQINSAASSLNDELIQLRNVVANSASQRSKGIAEQLSTNQSIVIVLVLVLVAIAIGGFIIAQKQIAQPISDMADKLDVISKNRDLVVQLPRQSTDELCRMTDSTQGLMQMFKMGMRDVREAIHGIGDAVSQLANSTSQSGELVVGLRNDISSLVGLMETLESDMAQSLQYSQSASQAANETAGQIDTSRQQVEKTAQAISGLAGDIEQTASMLDTLRNEGNNVSSVVETIAQIADQTNLLALNAAIEAARAGDSGRGFAVVADEVRTLAVRTHQSTVEINAMLEKIVQSIKSAVATMSSNQDKAHASVVLANALVESLENGRNSILSLVDVSQQAASLAQHAKGKTGEAKDGVTSFTALGETLAQGNDSVQQAAANLTHLADNLTNNVRQFKLD